MHGNVLVVGAGGQLGRELSRTVPESVQLSALDASGLDITDQQLVMEQVISKRPDWIINAAAYTAVDKAEEQSDMAYRVNRDGAANLATAAKQAGARLIQISTDFVFDGTKSSPYQVDDVPNPQSVYGASKQLGDEAVLSVFSSEALIIRTAWVYSNHGQNFVKTMLRLMAKQEELGIVADQIGTPTWAHGLARMIWQAMEAELTGMHHWTDAGVASWYDFAVAIYEEAKVLGLLSAQQQCRIKPIRTRDYPTPAKRPAYSVLDKTTLWNTLAIEPEHWRTALRNMLGEFVDVRNN
jgi:dTDP-4-dehydrorhamnose reductase